MIKVIYFDERELLVRKEIETKTPKTPKPKSPKCYPVKTSTPAPKYIRKGHNIIFTQSQKVKRIQ